MRIEYQILFPVSDHLRHAGLFKSRYIHVAKSETLDSILSKFLKIGEFSNDRKANQIICACGCESFLAGGTTANGIIAVKCKDCFNEIVFRKHRKRSKYFSQRAPWVSYMLKSGNWTDIVWHSQAVFSIGPVVNINGNKYKYIVEKYCSAYGSDYCYLYGKLINRRLIVTEGLFIECESKIKF